MDEARETTSKIHVVAGSVISCGSWHGPVRKSDFHTEPDRINCGEIDTTIKIVSELGVLQTQTRCSNPWYQYMQPARDIYEQNMTLIRSRDEKIYLQATRDIAPGETITWWYDEALAWDLKVPYLTPANILGIGRYCCIACQKEFTYPNHLKLHIMNSCPVSKPRTHSTLQTGVKECIDHMNDVSNCNVLHQSINRKYVIDLKQEPNDQKRNILSKCSTRSLQTQNTCISRYTLKASFELVPDVRTITMLRDCKPYQNFTDYNNPESYLKKNNFETVPNLDTDDDEPMEILRKSCSFMSSSKGHLCVFCGKLYSRKYGLKIHLRTHTGYKPLKCKVCLRAFGDPSNLNKHIRLHAQGGTPYQCTYCGKILVRRRDLVRHLKSRHPDEVTQ